MEPILVELKSGASTDKDQPHEGEEFGYVISGTLMLQLGSDKHKCKSGDSFYYKPDKVHYIKNESKDNVKFLWVSSPPNF
jgi:quercetin dioxygenase-like cupin family protein